jgi:hypothetical protein
MDGLLVLRITGENYSVLKLLLAPILHSFLFLKIILSIEVLGSRLKKGHQRHQLTH